MQLAEPGIYWRHLSSQFGHSRVRLPWATVCRFHVDISWGLHVSSAPAYPTTTRSPPAQLSHHTSLLPSLLLILKVSFASSCGTLSSFLALITSHSHISMYRLKLEARICILERTSDIYHSELMLPPQVFLAPSIFLHVWILLCIFIILLLCCWSPIPLVGSVNGIAGPRDGLAFREASTRTLQWLHWLLCPHSLVCVCYLLSSSQSFWREPRSSFNLYVLNG